MLPHFCIDQIACASLECLFFGKSMVVDDDTLFCKGLLLHPCSISFMFVFLIPFMWASGPVASCSLCLGFVCILIRYFINTNVYSEVLPLEIDLHLFFSPENWLAMLTND